MSKVQPTNNRLEFYVRRLHSLAGLIPLTFFLVFHLSANSFAFISAERFNDVVNFLRSLPYLEGLEITMLAIPFLFHGVYGLVISPHMPRSGLGTYQQVRNWTYFLQRVSGILTFTFLLAHIWMFKFTEHLDFNYVAGYLKQTPWFIFYFLGVTASVYHLANGLWNFCISWGITARPAAQKFAGYISMMVGLALWVVGMVALYAFVR